MVEKEKTTEVKPEEKATAPYGGSDYAKKKSPLALQVDYWKAKMAPKRVERPAD